MEPSKQNVGIEVDSKEIKVSYQILKDDWSVKVLGSRTFKNSSDGFSALEGWIEKKKAATCEVHMTMEATGVYYENLAYYFHQTGKYSIHVLLPNMTNAYGKSLNKKSKTDQIDAKILGQMGLERQLNCWEPMSEQMRTLKKRNRERLQLLREKNLIANQLHAEQTSYDPSRSAIKRYQKRLEFMDKQIKEIEKELKKKVDEDPELKQRIDHACTAKGLGFTTVCGVVAELNGFALFKNRNQVVSYAGYDVVKNESGANTGGQTKISKKGNSYVRQMLYMPAMSAARTDPHHKAYYQRIVDKTNIKMKGNVAIQRKLLLLIYTLFKNNVPYIQNHHELRSSADPSDPGKGRQDALLPTLNSTLNERLSIVN